MIVISTRLPAEKSIGQRFGRLIAISVSAERKRHRRQLVCVCDCGIEVVVTANALRSGTVRSCGCLFREHVYQVSRATIHGCAKFHQQTKEYRSYHAMKARVMRAHGPQWNDYGGRGIKVCQRWLDSFQIFLSDMGPAPTDLHTLDRVDVNGNYEPGNCRWATKTQQSRNRRDTLKVEWRGKSWVLRDLAEEAGIKFATLKRRIAIMRWGVDRAVTTPVR